MHRGGRSDFIDPMPGLTVNTLGVDSRALMHAILKTVRLLPSQVGGFAWARGNGIRNAAHVYAVDYPTFDQRKGTPA
jgi:hypothetical protein